MKIKNIQGPRGVFPEELGSIFDLVNRVFRTGIDQNMETDYPLVFREENLENLRVITYERKIVSHLAVAPRHVITSGASLQVGMISSVATDPDFRGYGLATQLGQTANAKMVANGCGFGLLWTSIPSFYRRNDWEVIPNGWCYLPKISQAKAFKSQHTIRPLQIRSDLNRLITLHKSQPGGVTRQYSDSVALYTLPSTKVWIAERVGKIEGYAVMANSCNKFGMVEWGGSPTALESLLATLLSCDTERALPVFVPRWENPMTELMKSKGISKRVPMENKIKKGKGCEEMMVRILSIRRLMEDLLPYIKRLWKSEDASVTFVLEGGEESVTLVCHKGQVLLSGERSLNVVQLSHRDMARLIFGPGKPSEGSEYPSVVPDWLDQFFPVPFYIWVLDYV